MSSPNSRENDALTSLPSYFDNSTLFDDECRPVRRSANLNRFPSIPTYDSTLGITSLVDFIKYDDPNDEYQEEDKIAMLRAQGWPCSYDRVCLRTYRPRSDLRYLFSERKSLPKPFVPKFASRAEHEAYQKANPAPTVGKNASDSNRDAKPRHFKYVRVPEKKDYEAPLWRVPCPNEKLTRVDKPTVYSYTKSRFRRWVYGEAAYFLSQINKRSQFVSGNDSCKLLFKGKGKMSRKSFEQHLALAIVHPSAYVTADKPPGPIILPTSGLRSVTLYGVAYDAHNYVAFRASHSDVIRDNMPHFKRVQSYLDYKWQFPTPTEVATLLSRSYELCPPPLKQEEPQQVPEEYKSYELFPEGYPDSPPDQVEHKLQGNISAVPTKFSVEHTHSVKVDLPQIVTALSGIDGWDRVAVQVTSFLTSVLYAASWQSALAAVTQFVAANSTVWAFVKDRIFTLEAYSPQGVMSDILASIAQTLLQPLWEIVSSATVITILEAISREAALLLAEPILTMIRGVNTALLREGSTSIAKLIVEQIQNLFKTIMRCWETKSFSPLWGTDWDPQYYVFESRALRIHYAAITGLRVDNFDELKRLRDQKEIPTYITHAMTLGEYLEHVSRVLQRGSKLLSFFGSKPTLRSLITDATRALQTHYESAALNANAFNERVAPFHIFYYGSPGTGKTNMALQVLAALAAEHSFDPRAVYQWVPNANFQTGFNHLSWAVLRDDVDQGVAPPAAGIANHVEEVIRLVNNAPYPVEQSESHLKGSVYASPVAMASCSNYKDSNAKAYCKAPDAFFRRIHKHVTVEVKPEFADGKILDKVKAALSNTHDMYDLYVSEFDPSIDMSHKTGAFPFKDAKKYSFPEFMVMIRQEFRDHLERERCNLVRRAATGARCPVCYLTTDRSCTCSVELKTQGRCSSIYRWVNFTSYLEELEDFTAAAVCEAFSPSWFTRYAAISVAAAGSLLLLRKITEKFQSRELVPMPGPTNWFRADQTYKPGVPLPSYHTTYTYEELVKTVSQSVFPISSDCTRMNCAVVGHSLVLVPTHLAKIGEQVTIHFPQCPIVVTLDPTNFSVLPSNSQLMLIKVPNCRPTASITNKFWEVAEDSLQQFDELEIWTETKIHSAGSCSLGWLSGSRVLYAPITTNDGDCGSLYLARKGRYWRIVGMHYMLQTVTRITGVECSAIAAIVTRDELAKVAETLSMKLQGLALPASCLSLSQDFSFSCYPRVSEALVALTHDNSFHCMGSISPPISGSTMKTKITRSLLFDHARELEEEFCGKVGYWTVPHFKGKMEGSRWKSAFTDSFAPQKKIQLEWKAKWLAIADYLSPVHNLPSDGYRALSENEVICGQIGGFSHSVNLRTSVGPPYNRTKASYVAMLEGQGVVSEEIWTMFDDLQSALDAGEIPVSVGLCTLKDAVIKDGSNPRVFTNLSFAFNMLAKKYLTPVKDFMRRHFQVFESAVGINMTSPECNKVVNHLKTVGPLENLFSGDVVKLDKSHQGEHFDVNALVWYGLSFYLGCNPFHVMSIIYGIKNTIFSIKNDMFCTFWNPSGHDATVEINGVTMAIGERYVYYLHQLDRFDDALVIDYARNFLKHPFLKVDLSFRLYCAVALYGDDNAKNFRYPPPASYCQDWNRYGLTMTSADKSDDFRMISFDELSFLKRTFVWWDEVGMYVPPISKKTLVRMLLFKAETSLSDRDHAVIVIDQCLRESVYHGREFYARMVAFFRRVCKDLSLNSPSLQFREFDYHLSKIREGTFSTWERVDLSSPLPLCQT